jgi:hypothetical protein
MARSVGLTTRSDRESGGTFQVVNRLCIEELEAWFFGDPQAISAAYPRVSPTLGTQARYRHPDTIKGGTAEALERVLQRAGYYPAGMPKIEVARSIARHMLPDRNTSPSFQVFRDALQEMTSVTIVQPEPESFRTDENLHFTN